MKDRKGFTLIELLAVIVILSIIMVIAIPQILNVIDVARSSAAKSSMELLKRTIKSQVESDKMIGSNLFTKNVNDDCYLFDFDNKNNNYEALKLKNKDKFTGSINYCDGKFSDSSLAFDGNQVQQETKKYLYNRGNEYTSYTGGWTLENSQTHSRSEKLSDSLHAYISTSGSSGTSIYTNNSIDLSGYNRLYVNYKINNTYSNEDQYNCLWYSLTSGTGTFISHATAGTYTDVLDISNLNSSTVAFVKYDADVYIYEVWLEK